MCARGIAWAQGDEIQVYDGGLAAVGVFNLTVHNNFTPKGLETPAFPGAVVADKSLSMYAHNVKIIAQDGLVTLKGPVRSEAEKAAVEAKAAAVVGQAKVTNQIEIKP